MALFGALASGETESGTMAEGDNRSTSAFPSANGADFPIGSVHDRDIWEQTFDAVSDPISVVDDSYRIIAANAAYKRMFGLPEGALAPHQCFEDDGGDHACEGCPLEATTRYRSPHMIRQARLVRVADAEPPRWERRVYHRWTYPIFNEDGDVHRIVEILRDVTEQERVRELITEAEALRRADQLKAELLGAVSHELRSPLTTIRGYAETLAHHERQLSREERQEFLDAIIGASDRLAGVIERLLLLSRLETGEDVMERVPVDLGRLAWESLLAIPLSERSRITLRIAGMVDGGPPVTSALALGDPRRMRVAVDALVDNALKYSRGDGHVELEVRTVTEHPSTVGTGIPEERADTLQDIAEQRYIEVIVRDDGQGIPQESQSSIFDAFQQVETGLTKPMAGLGLGLAICKRIVALNHGKLWVESEPGSGSAFHMLFPAFETIPVGS